MWASTRVINTFVARSRAALYANFTNLLEKSRNRRRAPMDLRLLSAVRDPWLSGSILTSRFRERTGNEDTPQLLLITSVARVIGA